MPLKILMLHGYTQSAPLFHAKTRALEKNLQKAFSTTGGCKLFYLTAPHVLSGADIPNWDPTTATITSSAFIGADSSEARAKVEDEPEAFGWWRRRNDTFLGLEEGFASIADALVKEGPFDGVIGFSQGGAMAAFVASLLEEPLTERQSSFAANEREGGGIPFPKSFLSENGSGRIHSPLKFAVSYSGFASVLPEHKAFYNPKIKTPMLHFLGSLDTVVVEKRSLSLVEACDGPKRVVYHPGGHFVPSSQKEYVSALVGFIRDVLSGSMEKSKEEARVEDMDLPF